jgi:hypothetical protein
MNKIYEKYKLENELNNKKYTEERKADEEYKTQIEYIAEVFKWFDKINGNTYHAVNLYDLEHNLIYSSGLNYGYGEHYKQTLKAGLKKLNLYIEIPLSDYVFFSVNENALKRDLKKIEVL